MGMWRASSILASQKGTSASAVGSNGYPQWMRRHSLDASDAPLPARITASFKRSPNRPSERLHMTPFPGRWQIRWQVGIGGRSGARQLRKVHDLRRGREHLPLRASCKPGRSQQSAKMASSP